MRDFWLLLSWFLDESSGFKIREEVAVVRWNKELYLSKSPEKPSISPKFASVANFCTILYLPTSAVRYRSSDHVSLPCSNSESKSFVRYSKLLGIFLLKLADDVESNITSATFNGIPPGFAGRSRTSFFGTTCICKSDFVSPEDVLTSTRMKSASTDTFPKKAPLDEKKNINISSNKDQAVTC